MLSGFVSGQDWNRSSTGSLERWGYAIDSSYGYHSRFERRFQVCDWKRPSTDFGRQCHLRWEEKRFVETGSQYSCSHRCDPRQPITWAFQMTLRFASRNLHQFLECIAQACCVFCYNLVQLSAHVLIGHSIFQTIPIAIRWPHWRSSLYCSETVASYSRLSHFCCWFLGLAGAWQLRRFWVWTTRRHPTLYGPHFEISSISASSHSNLRYCWHPNLVYSRPTAAPTTLMKMLHLGLREKEMELFLDCFVHFGIILAWGQLQVGFCFNLSYSSILKMTFDHQVHLLFQDYVVQP